MLATRTVTTTGRGSVAVPRDRAILRLTARGAAATLAEALTRSETSRASVVEVARRHVPAHDVATERVSTWRRHDDEGAPAGFAAEHALSVACADLATASAVLQAVVDEVGDDVDVEGVELAASPTVEDHTSARGAAFDDARARAEHLAGLAGATLGGVVSVVEGGGVGPSRGGGGEVLALSAKAVDLEGGTSQVAAAVTVTWELG
ncbi:SIMPL domain-containing protein [Nocardioides litoris]|uniref:SIMPL domain-containing protein n=1 Tax=Nocardioides litoris TaxID=1926648 RepID=UPI0011226AC8|nr:SIMPL domain-containing protein [Nocardioides litoris]